MLEGATRRRLLLAAGVAVVAALCVAAILLAGPRTQEASRSSGPDEGEQRSAGGQNHAGEPTMMGGLPVLTGEEALVQDARSYAKDLDVSLEEAIRRLEMQGDTLPTRLERELKEKERDTFAGLWLRHKPDYGITIASTGDPEAMMAEVEPFVEGTQWEGTVRIKRVDATESELNAARAEAERIFNRLGIPHESGDNIMKNRMEFFVANKTRFERELRASGLELPEHIVVLEGMSRPDVPE